MMFMSHHCNHIVISTTHHESGNVTVRRWGNSRVKTLSGAKPCVFLGKVARWLLHWLIASSSDSLIHCFVPSSIHWFIDSLAHCFIIDSFRQLCMDSCMPFHWHLNNHLLIRWCISQLQHFVASASQKLSSRHLRPTVISLVRHFHPHKCGALLTIWSSSPSRIPPPLHPNEDPHPLEICHPQAPGGTFSLASAISSASFASSDASSASPRSRRSCSSSASSASRASCRAAAPSWGGTERFRG